MDNRDLEMDMIYNFKKLSRSIHKYRLNQLNKMDKENDLKLSEMTLLFYLEENDSGEGLKASRVSKILNVAPPTATPLLNSLERMGYIERERDKRDRRVLYVKSTQKGKAFVEKMKEDFKKTMYELIKYLGEEDTETFIKLSKKIQNFIDENIKKDGSG